MDTRLWEMREGIEFAIYTLDIKTVQDYRTIIENIEVKSKEIPDIKYRVFDKNNSSDDSYGDASLAISDMLEQSSIGGTLIYLTRSGDNPLSHISDKNHNKPVIIFENGYKVYDNYDDVKRAFNLKKHVIQTEFLETIELKKIDDLYLETHGSPKSNGFNKLHLIWAIPVLIVFILIPALIISTWIVGIIYFLIKKKGPKSFAWPIYLIIERSQSNGGGPSASRNS